MATIVPDPTKIQSFRTEAAFAKWLSANHARATEIWLKIHKKGSGLPTITHAQALDVALCWGWIDGLRKPFDDRSFLQRFSPRKARSLWSRINRDHVARLTAAGRMTPHGQRQVDAAKADGRWDRAYRQSDGELPAELQEALNADPALAEAFASQSAQNRIAMAFRVTNLKRPESRAARVAEYVEMLKRGETIH